MEIPQNSLSLKRVLTELVLTLLFNTLIALFVTLLINGYLKISLIYSQSIGLSIFFVTYTLTLILGLSKPKKHTFLIAIPLGGLLGVSLAHNLIDYNFQSFIASYPNLPVILIVCTLVFGSIISYYFYARSTLAENQTALQEAALQQLENDKKLTEIHLKLLQAQIEPHFLFNTLSNILSLIDESPQEAKIMLTNLTQYLRASLKRTREAHSTLGDEIELLRAYLDIYTLRMGERLQYHIEIPDTLQAMNFPPLLLQPIVENAIKHGIAPDIEGGKIEISANLETEHLNILCIDTGKGLTQHSGKGMGLKNVSARLQAIYGNQASLRIQPNTPKGVKVSLSIPLKAV
jgi:sensor histidine kinase YesM